MTDPVPAQATGSFDERAPAGGLRTRFAAVWVHRMDPTEAPPVIVMPDATVDLEWFGGRFRIAGGVDLIQDPALAIVLDERVGIALPVLHASRQL